MRRRHLTVLLLGCCAACSVAFAAPGRAVAADGVQITSDEGTFTFGESLVFAMSATSDPPIADVVLHYRVGADAPLNRRIPEFTPGGSVTARHTEKVARGQIPPVSEISWWWTLTDAAGHVTETGPQRARYLDTRFEWQHTDAGDVVVWWYGAPSSFAEGVAGQARSALADLGQRIGTPADRPIQIVTYQSRQDMLGALIDRGGTFESRLSTLGARVAPDILLLLAGDDNPELADVIRHELSHIVLHLRLAREYLDVPAWLDEGLAMYAEGKLAPDEASRLQSAMRSDQLLSLRSLSTFPGQAELVPLAYAESRDVVAWLVDRYGEEQLRALFATLATGRYGTDEALQQVYGTDQLGLYQAYRAARNLGPAATPEPGAVARRHPTNQGGYVVTALFCAAIWCVLLLVAAVLGGLLLWVLRGRRR